jgi:hypothetical protein
LTDTHDNHNTRDNHKPEGVTFSFVSESFISVSVERETILMTVLICREDALDLHEKSMTSQRYCSSLPCSGGCLLIA